MQELSHHLPPSPAPERYVLMPDYLGDTTSTKRFRVTEKAAMLSVKSLIDCIDVLFEDYVTRKKEPHFASHWINVLAETPLSSALKEHFKIGAVPERMHRFYGKGFDFQDSSILSPEELMQTLLRLSRVGDLVCEVHHTERTARKAGGGSPLEHAIRLLFKDSFEPYQTAHSSDYMFTVERFFNELLREKLFTPAPSTTEIAQKERFDISIEFTPLVEVLLTVTGAVEIAPQEAKTRATLAHQLLLLGQTATIEEQKKLIALMDGFTPHKNNFLEQLEALIQKVAPRILETSFPEEKMKFARCGELLYLLPADNFYFQDRKENDPSEEWSKFPDDGRCLGEKFFIDRTTLVAETFDLCVFDPDGFKVFWGDLLLSEIKDIQGPFYILSSSDGYHSIPPSVVIDTAESRDTYREKKYGKGPLPISQITERLLGEHEDIFAKREAARINPDYMRIKALGKIKDGGVIANLRELPRL